MRFQTGQSGNPAGRPPGSLNKKTLATQEALQEQATEVAKNLIERAKGGDLAAIRMCLDRFAPIGRNRPVAIELPVIKTPEDAKLALAVVTDELPAGELTISEAAALVTLIERMLRVAERMWKFQRARSEAAAADQEATKAKVEAPQTAEKPAAPLYSPVNSGIGAKPAIDTTPEGHEAGAKQPAAPREDTPLSRAA
jgi:Family of unknown function (DUF5681)